MNIAQIIAENTLRNRRLQTDYNPMLGIGCCGNRVKTFVEWEHEHIWLPAEMVADAEWRCVKNEAQYRKLRFKYDFEYWCASCINIRQKISGRIAPLILNHPQRRVLATLEEDRKAGRPIRIILLKARQWGGSTLIQIYMAWIQIVHRKNWHSLITAHVKNTAATLRKLYADTLSNYPKELWDEDEKPVFKPMPDAPNTRIIQGRGACVTLASSFSPDSFRGLDIAMAHLSEVAFWQDSDHIDPGDLLRSICGTIPLEPYSLIVLESTANGVGNFFHSEWIRARAGDSAFRPVFIPWYDIEIYRLPIDDKARFISEMTESDMELWNRGLTLEMIAWYRAKLRELGELSRMQAEYPSDDLEAFVNSSRDVFSSEAVEALRSDCRNAPMVGELQGRTLTGEDALSDITFIPDPAGKLMVWTPPDHGCKVLNRYVVAVDVGGRSRGSDYSVIAVFDRFPTSGGKPEVVAQWRGHCDHDILGWKAATIASWYCNALLAIESNSLDSASEGSAAYILEELNAVYPNLYARTVRTNTSGRETIEHRVGFHTNHRTKALIITLLIAMVREKGYCERFADALTEMAVYQQLPSGNYAAKKGFNDDVLMTRAIGLYICSTLGACYSFDADKLLSIPSW